MITPVDQSAPLPAQSRPYHHGDLRKALLAAAVEELAEKGIEGLTLRGCARRAGVSHAAPAHHFGDVTGLLTEVAIAAQAKLAATMREAIARAERGSAEHVIASALGYVRFALEHPGEFGLMFRRERLRPDDPGLLAAGAESFGLAADAVGAFLGRREPMSEPQSARQIAALWSLAHGFAGLMLAGQFGPVATAAASLEALLPDMVRALFGLAPANRPEDLATISMIARRR
ncbi:MAG: TetR/AcrR family transcriptional regulator [Devosia sp.]|uniref:TetR/AcrR family transcriptional regulator n=1 Tax=Devosia sp. TaxID=1871048 RepID=UPI001AD22364|nr:TetR/AcrR family transcriptional regulator [Devosia sp.]MBN9317540.1 TetR/AcrR family transcriptional regulator [Devosia sp.]